MDVAREGGQQRVVLAFQLGNRGLTSPIFFLSTPNATITPPTSTSGTTRSGALPLRRRTDETPAKSVARRDHPPSAFASSVQPILELAGPVGEHAKTTSDEYSLLVVTNAEPPVSAARAEQSDTLSRMIPRHGSENPQAARQQSRQLRRLPTTREGTRRHDVLRPQPPRRRDGNPGQFSRAFRFEWRGALSIRRGSGRQGCVLRAGGRGWSRIVFRGCC